MTNKIYLDFTGEQLVIHEAMCHTFTCTTFIDYPSVYYNPL